MEELIPNSLHNTKNLVGPDFHWVEGREREREREGGGGVIR